jgi:hypothetical protein
MSDETYKTQALQTTTLLTYIHSIRTTCNNDRTHMYTSWSLYSINTSYYTETRQSQIAQENVSKDTRERNLFMKQVTIKYILKGSDDGV